MVVPFFLTPFVVGHLGSLAYGIWILAVSTVSYLNLLDLGLRSAIVRFVSKARAEGKVGEAQSAINAALVFRVGVAGGIGLLSVGLAFAFPHMFKVPPAMAYAAKVTVLLCSLGVAVTLLCGVFGAVLSAIHRFDVLSSISIGQTVARASGVLLILHSGRGLVALAYWEFCIVCVAGMVTWGAARACFPEGKVRLHRPEMETLRKISSYSFVTFLIVIAVQVVFYTDNLVVGAVLSVSVVTYYTIGGSLAMYSGQVSAALGQTFIPLASTLDAAGRPNDLQRLLLRGTQVLLALSLPIDVALVLRGKTFIGLWVGPQYSEVSGTVLQILMISQFFSVANATASQIAFGVEKHKAVAKQATAEAALNLGLSVVLAKTIGVYGVAWGTSISMAVMHLAFWPRHVRAMVGTPVKTYLWQGWMKISLCVLPFAAVCALCDRWWRAGSMVIFLGQIVVTLPVYVGTVLLVFHEEARAGLEKWKGSRMAAVRS
jgi:O-antigen/teichoic acid export membrane protein